jgi:hypothetical protein
MTIGEFLIIEESRYPLLRLKIQADGRHPDEDTVIRDQAEELQIVPLLEETLVTFDIPFIQ